MLQAKKISIPNAYQIEARSKFNAILNALSKCPASLRDDLRQQAELITLEAKKRFSGGKASAYEKFLNITLQNGLTSFILAQGDVSVSVPTKLRYYKILEAAKKLNTNNIELIATAVKESPETVINAFRYQSRLTTAVRLDKPVTSEEGSAAFSNFVPAEDTISKHEHEILIDQLKDSLASAVSFLSNSERDVVFRLLRGKSISAIAKELGTTSQQVTTWRNKAFFHLRQNPALASLNAELA